MRDRVIIVAMIVLAVVMPATLAAQVTKQVEVTKEYIPDVAPATKLAITPDMTDTVRLRPDIDYSITPLSWKTNFKTEKFRPATLSYWEFKRSKPFYLKVGAGYPTHTEGDLYASTQNPDVGFLSFYVNHRGAYDDIKNYFGLRSDSRSMENRAGVAMGLYAGKRTVEGDFSYDNRMYRRYAGGAEWQDKGLGDRVNTGLLSGEIRFGDDFKDLSRVNFNLALRGDIFHDNSKVRGAEYKVVDERYNQYKYGASAALAKAFGKNSLHVMVDYDAYVGAREMSYYRDDVAHAAARYGRTGGVIEYLVGADYYYDKYRHNSASHYVTPFLNLRFNVSKKGHFIPYIDIDGEVLNNSYMSLSRINPFVETGFSPEKSTLKYNLRLGIAGNLAKDKIGYRVSAGLTFARNYRYWYVRDYMWFGVDLAKQNIFSYEAELSYRPISDLTISANVRGWAFSNNVSISDAHPKIEAGGRVEYKVRGWRFHVAADMYGESVWTNKTGETRYDWLLFTTPLSVDLSAGVEWQYRNDVGFYLEGRNLTNSRLYPVAYYADYGIGFMFGVKVQF